LALKKRGRRSSTAIAMTNNDPCPDTVFEKFKDFVASKRALEIEVHLKTAMQRRGIPLWDYRQVQDRVRCIKSPDSNYTYYTIDGKAVLEVEDEFGSFVYRYTIRGFYE